MKSRNLVLNSTAVCYVTDLSAQFLTQMASIIPQTGTIRGSSRWKILNTSLLKMASCPSFLRAGTMLSKTSRKLSDLDDLVVRVGVWRRTGRLSGVNPREVVKLMVTMTQRSLSNLMCVKTARVKSIQMIPGGLSAVGEESTEVQSEDYENDDSSED